MKREEKLKYEENLNKLLGTSIKFSRLSSEDLVALTTVLTDIPGMAGKLGIKIEKETTPQEKIATGVSELVGQWEGPAIRILRGLLEGREKKKE